MKKNITYLVMLAMLAWSGSSIAQEIIPATFEDLGLAAESHWCGNTSDKDYSTGTFKSGSFEFSNAYMPEYNFWTFFSYANYTGNEYTGDYTTQQWNNTAGGGHNSATYGVVYADNYSGVTEAKLIGFENGAIIPGMWVINTSWVADAIENGDGISGPFGKGDTLKLVITGTDSEDKETTTEYLLADYTSENENEWYAVNNWRWMDLSSLGSVVKIAFQIVSTKANDYGQTTPAYVCIDDLGISEHSGIIGNTPTDSFKVHCSNGYAIVTGTTNAFNISVYDMAGNTTDGEVANSGYAKVHIQKGLNIIVVKTTGGTKTYKVIG